MDLESKLPSVSIPKVSVDKTVLKKIIGYKLDAIYIYLIVFVLGEILISGGLYERGWIFGVVNSFFVLILALAWQYKRKLGTLKDQIIKALLMTIVYAALDFLLVDLLLEKFNNKIYTFWGTYVAYGIILLVPIFYLLIPQWVGRWRQNKVNEVEITLDKP